MRLLGKAGSCPGEIVSGEPIPARADIFAFSRHRGRTCLMRDLGPDRLHLVMVAAGWAARSTPHPSARTAFNTSRIHLFRIAALTAVAGMQARIVSAAPPLAATSFCGVARNFTPTGHEAHGRAAPYRSTPAKPACVFVANGRRDLKPLTFMVDNRSGSCPLCLGHGPTAATLRDGVRR